MGLPSRIQSILEAVLPYDPERVILFGSWARGDQDAFSDVDLVIIKETEERFLDRLERVYRLVRPTFGFDVLVYTPQEFRRMLAEGNALLEQVLAEGKVIYENPRTSLPWSKEGCAMKDPRGEARRWMQQAQQDLAAARHSLEGGYTPLACFLAQQAAEKALKAYLYGKGERLVLGHSVGELLRECHAREERFAALVGRVESLDRYYLQTRYPNTLPGGLPQDVFKADEAQQAMGLAGETAALVGALIEEGEA